MPQLQPLRQRQRQLPERSVLGDRPGDMQMLASQAPVHLRPLCQHKVVNARVSI